MGAGTAPIHLLKNASPLDVMLQMSHLKKTRSTKKTSMDTDYNTKIKEFNHEHKQLPNKNKKLRQLQAKYEFLSKKNMNEMTDEEITNIQRIKSEISDLKLEIEQIENLDKETSFYLDTSELFFKYYDTDEAHPTVGSTCGSTVGSTVGSSTLSTAPTTVPTSPVSTTSQGKGKVTSSGVGAPASAPAPTLEQFVRRSSKNPKSDTDQTQTPSIQRADLYEEYLSRTDPHHATAVTYDKTDEFCQNCGQTRQLVANEALMICPKCGSERPTILESDKPSYRDPPHENMYFAYKRINHFIEYLSHCQAKETTKIPQEIFDIILIEFNKEGGTNLAELTKDKVKKYFQKYNHLGSTSKYYENINQIICQLNGIKPFTFKPEGEEQMRYMFMKIQEPFEKHCPPGRTNFLSYTFVTYKFCQLLGYDEYLPYFNLLKSKDKLRQQDKIWKNICAGIKMEILSLLMGGTLAVPPIAPLP